MFLLVSVLSLIPPIRWFVSDSIYRRETLVKKEKDKNGEITSELNFLGKGDIVQK